jgi:hypothetical protein
MRWNKRLFSSTSFIAGTGPLSINGANKNPAPPIAMSSFLLAGIPLSTIVATEDEFSIRAIGASSVSL